MVVKPLRLPHPMKPKPSKRIDKLLGELGLHFSKVARYRRERMPKGCERPAQAQPASRSLASSFRHPLTSGLQRGRATCAARKGQSVFIAAVCGKSIGIFHTFPKRCGQECSLSCGETQCFRGDLVDAHGIFLRWNRSREKRESSGSSLCHAAYGEGPRYLRCSQRSWSSSEKVATKTFRKTPRREFMTGYCSGTLMSHRSSF